MRDSAASPIRRWTLATLAALAIFAGAGSDAHASVSKDPGSFCERQSLEYAWRDANWSDGTELEDGSSRPCRQANWSD